MFWVVTELMTWHGEVGFNEVSCPPHPGLSSLCLPLVSSRVPTLCTVCLGLKGAVRVNQAHMSITRPKSSQRTFLTTVVMLPAPGTGLHHRAGSPPGGLKGQLTDSWFQLWRSSGPPTVVTAGLALCEPPHVSSSSSGRRNKQTAIPHGEMTMR